MIYLYYYLNVPQQITDNKFTQYIQAELGFIIRFIYILVCLFQEAKSLKAGDVSHQESKNLAHSAMTVTTDHFSTSEIATEASQERQRVTSNGIFNQKQSSSSMQTYMTKGIHTTTSSLHSSASQVSIGIQICYKLLYRIVTNYDKLKVCIFRFKHLRSILNIYIKISSIYIQTMSFDI